MTRAPSMLLLLLLLLAGCGSASPCSTQIREVARDLGSDRYATTEVRNCGATTGFVTVVRVGRAGEPQDDAEEVFVADSDHGAATDEADGAIRSDVVWTHPGKLLIAHAARARVFKRRATAKGAAVRFNATDADVLPPIP